MRIEIGPGHAPLGGDWIPCTARWGEEPLPYRAASISAIYASHVIEHVSWERTHEALLEAHRVLVPGGSLELWTLDLELLVRAYLEKRCGDDWRRGNPESDPARWFNGRMFAYTPPADNAHRATFDPPYLSRCLHRAGFEIDEVFAAEDRGYGASHGPCEFGVGAIKPL